MNTLYLAPGTSISPHAGTMTDPIRVRDAREFDDVLRRKGVHRFLLHPGAYETRGAWAFPERDFANLGANCELIGMAGSFATTIRLASDYEKSVATPTGSVPAIYVEAVIAGARVGRSDHLRIEGITFDCTCDLPVVGLHIFSSRAQLRDVRVTHLWGDWIKTLESFGILINNCQKPALNGGHVLEDCRVEHVRPGAYITGIYCGVVDTGVPIELSHLSRCWVNSPIPASGKRSHAAYAANLRTRLVGCHADGFDRWFFCDTGDVADVLIDGCTGSFSYCAVDLPGKHADNNPIRKRSNIRMVNCSFDCLQPSADHAILLNAQDLSPGSDVFPVEDVSIDGCVVRSVPTQFYTVSIKAAHARRIAIRNSQLPDGAKTTDGVFLPTGASAVRFS